MRIVPITFKQASSFVAKHHRHNKPPTGHKVSIGVQVEGRLVGVAIIGRPSAREIDQPYLEGLEDNEFTAEITRCCTNGHRNACSKLYGAARKVAWAMGYTKIITYTLLTEDGASLRGAGFVEDGETTGGKWSRKSRPRDDDQGASDQKKRRWRAA